MITVRITDLSNRWQYYQWFIYGLMLLNKKKEINLEFDLPWYQRLLLHPNLYILYRLRIKIIRDILKHTGEEKGKALLCGYIIHNGKQRSFCIDSADSPYMFHGKLLKDVDVYFKMQCPKTFDRDGFRLGNVVIPWIDNEFKNKEDYWAYRAPHKEIHNLIEYQYKIFPLLVSIRNMGKTCDFPSLDLFYHNLIRSRKVDQVKKAMCYFGNAKGPLPSASIEEMDYDWESDIMAKYKNGLNHPNEKRAKIAKILGDLGPEYDSRIISLDNADKGNNIINQESIPFTEFSSHVAKFQYNINVSGYRMSIPGRFMDSFVCGTAIATDNLHVKWYTDFDEEVIEFGEMGYLLDSDVDYNSIEKKLANLPLVNRAKIIKKYEKYWAPEPCANYIVQTVISKQ